MDLIQNQDKHKDHKTLTRNKIWRKMRKHYPSHLPKLKEDATVVGKVNINIHNAGSKINKNLNGS